MKFKQTYNDEVTLNELLNESNVGEITNFFNILAQDGYITKNKLVPLAMTIKNTNAISSTEKNLLGKLLTKLSKDFKW